MNENKGDTGTQCYVSTPIDGHVIINSLLHSPLIGNSSLARRKKNNATSGDNMITFYSCSTFLLTIVIGRFVINRDVRKRRNKKFCGSRGKKLSPRDCRGFYKSATQLSRLKFLIEIILVYAENKISAVRCACDNF